MHSRNKSTENKATLKLTSKHYKTVLDESLKKYRKDISNKLQNLRTSNTREYWNILNNSNKTSKCSADIDALYEFFKVLNGNESSETCDNIIDQSDTVNELLDSPITREEIVNSINSLKKTTRPLAMIMS